MIGVIIVLYKNIDFNFLSLESHDEIKVFLIDNTPDRDLLLSHNNLYYTPLKYNSGIAYAQNVGISEALKQGCKYMIFFDQDSTINPDIILKLKEAFTNLNSKGIKVGAIGPAIVNIETSRLYKSSHDSTEEFSNVERIISSGCLTSKDVIEEVGGLESNLFIDLVDFEWCWRLSKYGYKVFICSNIHLPHQLGKTTFTFCKMDFNVTSPIRYKYLARNTLKLISRKYVPYKWKTKALIKLPLIALLMLFHPKFRGQRVESIKCLTYGIIGIA